KRIGSTASSFNGWLSMAGWECGVHEALTPRLAEKPNETLLDQLPRIHTNRMLTISSLKLSSIARF
ncbi:hypothetical protein, partial [Pseudomonas syringae]|uniref:hypothetical protein n=1 Tax=Pseudomonas syringae TaxID=317 RepID=UPI001E394E5F